MYQSVEQTDRNWYSTCDIVIEIMISTPVVPNQGRWTSYVSNNIPVNICLFKVTIETLEKGLQYV